MRRPGLLGACAVAAVGLAVAAFGSGGGGFGRTGVAPSVAPPPTLAESPALASRLAAIRQRLDIRPDQEVAWLRYADVMRGLEQATHDYTLLAAAGARDDSAELGRHALILSAALSDLTGSLDAEQFSRARSLAEELAGTVICRGLTQR